MQEPWYELSVTVAFLIGLFSALHCFGMCGGLVGAMTMSLRPSIRQKPDQLALYTLAYNSGRITSYAFAGLLVGWFGQALKDLLMPESGTGILRLLAAFMVIAMGLYISGLFPFFSRIEKLGTWVWQYLQPVGHRLLPVRSLPQAFLFGVVWGWLPCGLVYYALLIAPAKDGAINAAIFMAFFGLGTLIPMLSAGFLGGRLAYLQNSKKIRYISGLLLIFLGMISLLLAVNPGIHKYFQFHIF